MKTLVPCAIALAAALLAGHAQGDTRYRVIDLGAPLGGSGVPQGIGNAGVSINRGGWVAGEADLPGNAVVHAELWKDGKAMDLKTLGGPNSAVPWPNRNDNGLVVGISETAELQPLGEQWSCALAIFYSAKPDGHICRGFAWEDGVMTPLPTLGGDNGFATGVNDARQIVGWAETKVHDPSCVRHGQVLQFEAVMWVKQGGEYVAEALPPYGTDPDSAATAINQQGQVAGISGLCGGAVGAESAEHMVIWKDGKLQRTIPSLGGSYWNTPMDIDDAGDVVGFSDTPGDAVAAHDFKAFRWSAEPFDCNGTQAAGTCNLGVLPKDKISEALAINDRGQVVGISLGSTPYGQAFIYEDGKLTSLNELVLPGTRLFLTDAQDINDEGVITGQAYDPVAKVMRAFMAVPVVAGKASPSL